MNTTFAKRPKLSKDLHQFNPHPANHRRANPSNGTGLPLFLQRASMSAAGHQTVHPARTVRELSQDACEKQADRMAESVMRAPDRSIAGQVPDTGGKPSDSALSPARRPSILGQTIEENIHSQRGSGRPLPSEVRLAMENKFEEDFSQVRIHTDAQAAEMSNALGANAFTSGRDIYFGPDKFVPGGREGDRLLAHELTHVVQQGGQAARQVQFDLMQSLPTALGGFEIEMETRATPQPGMEGHIRFLPDPLGPYSARIGLIQVANVTDVGGSTTTPGSPLDWRNDGVGAEAGRMDLMTTGAANAPQGWFVDTRTDLLARGSSAEPYYLEPYGESVGDNEYGWLRSPTDVKNASIYDFPSTPHPDIDFDFETVAKAGDTQTIYGSLDWGFQIRSGVVQSEYAQAYDAETATFNEALERFRGYYTHEPIVIYFDTAQDMPLAGEEAKISGVLDYLSRYPDVMVHIEGYADERGSVALNNDLSQRRALNVERIAVDLGIDPTRIEYAVGWGETTQFAAGSNAGTWRANRRVVISFERTASTPIVMP